MSTEVAHADTQHIPKGDGSHRTQNFTTSRTAALFPQEGPTALLSRRRIWDAQGWCTARPTLPVRDTMGYGLSFTQHKKSPACYERVSHLCDSF